VIDRLLGEPKQYHPLVGFGYLATRYEHRLNLPDKTSAIQFVIGLLGVALLVAPFVVITYFVSHYVLYSWPVDVLVLYWAIGHQSLNEHIALVRDALQENDLALARKRVGMIVSRDTAQLNESQVIKASVETGLENGSDAIFAPLFWFCLLGAPAVVLYRLVNTLDAMWGYKTTQFLYFGKSAARIDDVLNYIPARLVALSYALLGNTRLALHCWLKQAPKLNSPNAGPVMVSGAGSLDVKLGGPTFYHGELLDKPFFGSSNEVSREDIQRSLSLIFKTLILWCVLITCVFALTSISLYFSQGSSV